jgi:hypothetical protein
MVSALFMRTLPRGLRALQQRGSNVIRVEKFHSWRQPCRRSLVMVRVSTRTPSPNKLDDDAG